MPTNAINELRGQLSTFALTCRARRWFGALFHLRITRAIANDIVREQRAQAETAFSAEQADLAAAQIIEQVTRDGKVTRSELSLLRKARRFIQRSARADHAISERAHLS